MPRWLTQLRLRFRSLVYGQRVERELDEEMQYHVDRLVDEGLRAGLPPDVARISARRRLRGIAQSMEACRDVRGLTFLDQRLQDLRDAFRVMTRTPSLAVAVVSVMAIGIGANTPIFTIVNPELR